MRRITVKVPVEPRVLGIDVSHHQGKIDFKKVAKDPQGVKFVIVRTGDGKTPDRHAARNLTEAKAAGLLVGTYHYQRGERDIRYQIALALSLINKGFGHPYKLDLPMCPDLEGHPDSDGPDKPKKASGAWQDLDPEIEVTTRSILRDLKVFVDTAKKETGLTSWIYTGVAWHWYVAQKGLVPEWAKEHDLWLPSYTARPGAGRVKLPVDPRGGAAPWEAPKIWQFSSTGRVDGIIGNVDLNWYLGTLEELTGLRRRMCV